MSSETFLKSINVSPINDYEDVYSFMKQTTTDIHNFSYYKCSSFEYLENEDILIHFICDNCFRKHSKTV
jgi:hypothetical protein